MRQRKGMRHRILDGKRFTVSIGGDYVADGSHRRPVVAIIDRSANAQGVKLYRTISIPLLHVRYGQCYKYRRFGGMRVYSAYQRVMRKVCYAAV